MKGRGFGVVMLLVVVAIVLLLATKAWQKVMPTAAQVVNPGSGGAVDDHGQSEAGEAVRSGNLPNLNDMRKSTSDHTQRVNEALEEAQ